MTHSFTLYTAFSNMIKVCMNFYSQPHILIIGFGAQANAWALNLRDSGLKITICLNENSPSLEKAKKLNFDATTYNSAQWDKFNLILLLTPDHTHLSILNRIGEKLINHQTIVIAHGFSFHYLKLDALFPHLNFALLAPKAIASEVRFNYETKRALTAVVDFTGLIHETDMATKIFQQLIKDLGITVGPVISTFEIEAKADLFSEQSILCSLIPYGARFAFDKLIEKGISSEIAYIECWHEVKLIADAMIKVGPSAFFKMISPNALLGSQKAKNIFFDEDFFKKLELLFEDINSNKFFMESETSNFDELRESVFTEWSQTKLQIEYNKIGKKLGNINS